MTDNIDFVWPHCPHCDREFRYDRRTEKETPSCCGEPFCRARASWDSDQWAGRARMARSRIATGLPLNDWDSEALRRSDQ